MLQPWPRWIELEKRRPHTKHAWYTEAMLLFIDHVISPSPIFSRSFIGIPISISSPDPHDHYVCHAYRA